jgi:hypothetical protein
LSFASYHRVLFLRHVILTSLCSEVNIYLFLYPKEVFHILKKGRKRKKKASAKQKIAAQKKLEVWLSDFIKPTNLADFTEVETGPIWLVCFVRFYQACELIRFYQGRKLVRFVRFCQGCELVRFYLA